MKICILTAGKGSRIGEICKNINKALLPINNKPIISHIIEKFDEKDSFVIGLGYKSDQVKTYLKNIHPDRKFTFVNIKNHDGPGSGPGLSLLSCKKYLNEPFVFVPCDCNFLDKFKNLPGKNWIGVSKVQVSEMEQYCNVLVKKNKVIEIRDKKKCGEDYLTYTGLLVVNDHKEFWLGLKKSVLIKKEHQVSNGLIRLMSKKNLYVKKIKWQDMGTLKQFQQLQKDSDLTSIAKTNEFIYFVNNKVVKYFTDEKIIDNRIAKSKIKQSFFPKTKKIGNDFYSYPFWEGKTFYSCATPKLFKKLLSILDKEIWTSKKVEANIMKNLCEKFYYEKTISRIKLFLKQNTKYKFPKNVNGKKILPLETIIKKIPWEELYKGIPTFIHGDLQFQNILYNSKLKKFLLIDWRQDFAGQIEFGDVYYDIAKLYGGIIMNYDYVLKDIFDYKENQDKTYVNFRKWKNSKQYQEILDDFISKKGLAKKKIKLLVGLIYINMSALHHYPFNNALIAYGSSIISDVLNEKEKQIS